MPQSVLQAIAMEKFFVLTACLFLALPAFAQTVEQDGANDPYGLKTELAERVYLKYHKAIHAEEDCNNRKFSDDDKLSMEKIIAARMVANSPDVAVGAARLLMLRRIADDQINDIIGNEGCDGPNVKKSLQFFDDRLASAAPQPAPAVQSSETQPQDLTTKSAQ